MSAVHQMKGIPQATVKARQHRIAVHEKRIERMLKIGNWGGVSRAADAIFDLESGVKELRIFVNRLFRRTDVA
jgi:hypothetical protein